jgi:MoaA/NifB/PqqE/SkfB family radical SAM enzyme
MRLNGKYYFGPYIPAFPSPIFNRHIQTELNKILAHDKPVNRLQVLQLAITNRCPLQCEHCFEWKNLNGAEPFTDHELATLVNKFQQAGCTQFHLTGGEPMVGMQRLRKLVNSATEDSEFTVLTSGLNMTPGNARLLKQAGVTGVIISLDHFDSALHNLFRGSPHAYDNAINAACYAKEAGLLTSFSICVTRSFVSKQNLLKYMQLARDCGVAFVQLLEPKPVGHYEGRDVFLSKEQMDILEDFYTTVNYGKEFNDYPVIIYHGSYQRKLGCLSGGDIVLYIDSAGFVDACPFCQTKSYHASKIISGEVSVNDLKIGGCPAYKTRRKQQMAGV